MCKIAFLLVALWLTIGPALAQFGNPNGFGPQKLPASGSTGNVLTSSGGHWISAAPGGSGSVSTGGTGRTTLTTNALLYGNGTSPVGMLAIGSALQYVRVNAGGNGLEYATLVLQAADEATLHLSGGVYSIISTYAGQSSLVTTGTLTSGSLGTGYTIGSGVTGVTQSQGNNSTALSTTAYTDLAVSNAIAGVNPAVAVQAATTTVLPNSPTYSNGSSGIAATLTQTGTAAVLIVDGYTGATGARYLIKNQATAANDGVYTLVQGVASITPWVLTRALDYDQPSDINNTGAIPVINGTVNGSTSWVETATVNTVGTDPLAFTQFSINPTTAVTTSRQIIAGTGMSGGGDLSADRTLTCTVSGVPFGFSGNPSRNFFSQQPGVIGGTTYSLMNVNGTTGVSGGTAPGSTAIVGSVLYRPHTTSAVNNNECGEYWSTSSNYFRYSTQPIISFTINPTDLANVQVWFGVGNNGQVGNFGGAPINSLTSIMNGAAAFRFSTNTGAADVDFQATTSQSSQTVTDTLVPVVTATKYLCQIDMTNPAQIVFLINGTVVATNTTNLPTSTNDLVPFFVIQTLTTAVKTWNVGRICVEAN